MKPIAKAKYKDMTKRKEKNRLRKKKKNRSHTIKNKETSKDFLLHHNLMSSGDLKRSFSI
jgi:hypothetical protein